MRTRKPRPQSPTEALRQKLEELEGQLADPSRDPIENCDLHIHYWRVRESLASAATRQCEDPRTGKIKEPTLAQQKMAFLHLRQASDQIAQWEQRRAAALKLEEIDLLRRCEEMIAKRHEAADMLEKIRT